MTENDRHLAPTRRPVPEELAVAGADRESNTSIVEKHKRTLSFKMSKYKLNPGRLPISLNLTNAEKKRWDWQVWRLIAESGFASHAGVLAVISNPSTSHVNRTGMLQASCYEQGSYGSLLRNGAVGQDPVTWL
jgi:hypothetical protein